MASIELFDKVRASLDNLNERERRLVTAMLVVLVGMLIVVPFFIGFSSIASLESENAELKTVLADIGRARPRLEEQKQERQQIEALYDNPAPSLGGFMEEKSQRHNIALREVNDQPELSIGNFTRRSIRVGISNLELRDFIEMVAEIKSTRHPIAIERIKLDRGRSRGDAVYNAKLGVNAYDRAEKKLSLSPADKEEVE